MLPILVFVCLGWLAWWLTRRIASFPKEFALLLNGGHVQRGPLDLLAGRSRVSGTFQGRSVSLHFQRADENQTGYAMVSVQTTVPDTGAAWTAPDPPVHSSTSELNTALWVLRDTHKLRVDMNRGWLRATWQPMGLFIFPGRFDPAKWQDVLRQMLIVASQLEAGTPQATGGTPGLLDRSTNAVPYESNVEAGPVPAILPRGELSRFNRGRATTGSHDRFGLGGSLLIVKLVAGVLILASFSMLGASAGIGLTATLSRGFALATGAFAVIVLIASVGAFVVAGWPAALLPNEREKEPGDAEGQRAFGPWLWLLLLALLALPVWMLGRLSPLSVLWRDMLRFLDENEIWEMAQEASDFSGIVLAPVVGILSIPAFEFLAAFGIVISACVLLVLLVIRSRTFPRTFVTSVLLLAGVVAAAEWAVHAASGFTDLLGSQLFNQVADQRIQAALTRYGDVTQSAANVLTVVIVGWLVWIPVLLYSRRVYATFRQ